MIMLKKRSAQMAGLMIVLSGTAIAGCSRQYQVTDVSHGDVYFTDSFPTQSYEEFGQATFVDSRTGATVTLTNVAVKKVGRKAANDRTFVSAADSDDD